MTEGRDAVGNSHREREKAKAAEGGGQIAERDPSATTGTSS